MKWTTVLSLLSIAAGLVILAMGAVFLFSFFGRSPPPTTADYVAEAKPWNPVVIAIYDYRADHGGSSPKDLRDLVPAYLPKAPADPRATISGDSLLIPANAPHTGLVYSFDPKDEGWTVGGDYGVGRLPVPKLAPSKKPTLTNP